MKPDFIIIPFEIKTNEHLRPTDGDVYGIIYWLEHLKDGRCTAGNEFIAEILGITERAVRAALERLEKHGFIQRFFLDPERKVRTEIKTLVRFAKISPIQPSVPGKPVLFEGERQETPGEYAKRFFTEGSQAKMEVLETIMAANPSANRDHVIGEMKKFIVYWTEPNKSGTKQKWQLQQTFDVKRRLYTWLSRSGTYQKASSKAGAGATI